jgi:chemotaxis protein MotB
LWLFFWAHGFETISACSDIHNWELSADRANAARRPMQMNGIRGDQITQVCGLADQRLRKPDTALDPVNRRISRIAQYIEKPAEAPAASTQPGGSHCTGEKKEAAAGEGQKKALAQEDTAKP